MNKLAELGDILQYKYADVDAEQFRDSIEQNVKASIANAAGNGISGIMPFISMATQDGIQISFDITKNDTWYNKQVNVYNLNIEPTNKSFLKPKYEKLPSQVKNYLEKYPDIFSSMRNGESLDYHNFTLSLVYP